MSWPFVPPLLLFFVVEVFVIFFGLFLLSQKVIQQQLYEIMEELTIDPTDPDGSIARAREKREEEERKKIVTMRKNNEKHNGGTTPESKKQLLAEHGKAVVAAAAARSRRLVSALDDEPVHASTTVQYCTDRR